MRAFVNKHRAAHGVEPICRVLQIAPSGYRRHAARQSTPALCSERAQGDEALVPHIERVWRANLQVYGARKVWRQLLREGQAVARRTVERLRRRHGLSGVIRGKSFAPPFPIRRHRARWTRSTDGQGTGPNQLWVLDFTHVSTWKGWLYVAFAIDVFAQPSSAGA